MNLKRCLCGWAFTSVILGTAGLILAFMAGSIFDLIIRNYVLLGPNSMSKDMWINTPKMQTSVYLFDIQNKDNVIKGTEKPKLVERGPYVYDEYHHKVNTKWNSQNGTVTYENQREYHFNAGASNGSLDEYLTIVNAPAASISYTAKYQMTAWYLKLLKPALSAFLELKHEKVFVKKLVREIIFDGYEDPLLTELKELQELLKTLKVPFPAEMDKFAAFYKRNMSSYYDGVFNLFTGRLDTEKANQMYSWNFTDQSPYFPDKCGSISGNGELFKPRLPQSKVAMFSNDLCRPLIFKFDRVQSVKGIWGNRYTIDDMFLANSTINKDNWCFEAPKSYDKPNTNASERLQFPSGVFNMGLCKFNSSTFISQPHFFQADPFYLNQFAKGSLSPDEQKHQTSIVIDPQSGIPLEVIARFQANVLIEPSSVIKLFEPFKKPIFIPAFWFETKMILPADLVTQMWALSNLQTIFLATGYTFFGLSLGAVVVILIYYQVGVIEVRRKGPVYVEDSVSTSPTVDCPTSSTDSNECDQERDDVPILSK